MDPTSSATATAVAELLRYTLLKEPLEEIIKAGNSINISSSLDKYSVAITTRTLIDTGELKQDTITYTFNK